jgi:pimeloyl-ACP methyl ester carboxylesterase
VIALRPGVHIAYDDVGSGLPIVFIHGFPHNRTLWAPQLGGLMARARCIAPDLRGFGESEVTGPYSMDVYADDVVAMLDALQIPRAVIAGLSMGGYVAFAIWRRHRERVRALILADTRAGPDGDEAIARRREMIALARAKGSGAVADSQIGGMVGRTTRDKHPDIADAVHHMLTAAPVEGVVGALEAMIARPDSTPTLATIDVPTMIIVGEEDALTPPKEARAMHALIPGSRLEILEGAGHVSNVERPAAFNHVTSEFLGVLTYA